MNSLAPMRNLSSIVARLLVITGSFLAMHSIALAVDSDSRLAEIDPPSPDWVEAFEAMAPEQLKGRGVDVQREYLDIISTYSDTDMTPEVRAIFEKNALNKAKVAVIDQIKEEEELARPKDLRILKKYMVVPIHGAIGEEVVGEGLDQALRYALHEKADYIIFDIDTPGGSVAEAHEIRDLLHKYEDDFEYVALVRNAISAGIWIAFNCHHVIVEKRSTLGGAVIFSEDQTTGSLSVDAKFSSIEAATLAADADTKGYPPMIVRAMVIMDVEVYAWNDGGEINIHEAMSDGLSPELMIVHDSPKQVLTLTGSEAVDLGIATYLDEDDPLPFVDRATMRVEATRQDGTRFMQSASRQQSWKKKRAKEEREDEIAELEATRENIAERLPKLARYINANRDEAIDNDPENYTYLIDEKGIMTWDSLKAWRARTDRAIWAWRRAGEGAAALVKMEKLAKDWGVPTADHDINPHDVMDRAAREIDKLSRNRSKRRF